MKKVYSYAYVKARNKTLLIVEGYPSAFNIGDTVANEKGNKAKVVDLPMLNNLSFEEKSSIVIDGDYSASFLSKVN